MEPHRYVEKDETIHSRLTDLRTKASRFEFGSADVNDTMIRDEIVFGVRSERVKMKLLKERDLNLSSGAEICRVDEVSKKQFQCMKENLPSGGNIDVIQGQRILKPVVSSP